MQCVASPKMHRELKCDPNAHKNSILMMGLKGKLHLEKGTEEKNKNDVVLTYS